MVVALRLALVAALVVFGALAFQSGNSGAMSGGVLALIGAFGLLVRGLAAPLEPFEALLCVVFPLGLLTAALPPVAQRLIEGAACGEGGALLRVLAWLAGTAITCAGAAVTVLRFRPRLSLKRVPSARWLWALTGAGMVAGSVLALLPDRCDGGHAQALALPALTNALLALYLGWYLGERRRG